MGRCAKCLKETNSNFSVYRYGYLCYNCAVKYTEKEIKEIQEEIDKLKFSQNCLRKEVKDSCLHENGLIYTKYTKIEDGKIFYIYRCLDCGEQIFKEEN